MAKCEKVKISDHFTYGKIIRFIIGPILMMVFTSLYGVVDGFFISNYAGLNEYAGVNLIMPFIMIIGGVGFMFGTGGSALVGKLLGEKNKEQANKVFTMIIQVALIVGIIISGSGFFLIKPIANALASVTHDSTEEMVNCAIRYGRILVLGQVFFIVQNVFHGFLMVDGKPELGFKYTLFAGLTNMFLDFLFVGVFKWSLEGAAAATIMGCIVGSVLPLIHFFKNKSGNIVIVSTHIEWKPILKSCFNGASEFVNNISSCIVGLIFNIQLLKFYGQAGISAYGTLMYVSFIFFAILIGISIGISPIISFNYGAQNHIELQNVTKKGLIITTIVSISMFLLSETLGPLFASLFVRSDPSLLELTRLAFKISSIQFIVVGFSIFISSLFTALNNGIISAIVSFLRTLIVQVAFVFILPLIFGETGIWWSLVCAEVFSFIVCFIFFFTKSKKYHYIPQRK